MVEPNETIDRAMDLGALNRSAEALGAIGTGADGAADVTWYHFSLTDASLVDIKVSTPANDRPFASVLSVYNNDPDDWSDPYDITGHRLLTQVQANSATGVAESVQELGPGDYYVAISGAGNLYFSPVVAGSGFDGATGNYDLTITRSDLGLSGEGPTLLSSDPASGAVLDASPLAIRLDLSDALDPSTIVQGQTVALYLAPDGAIDGSSSQVALASVNYSSTADELQLFPESALAPGHYIVWLAGDTASSQPYLADPNGLPLGATNARPSGANETLAFDVDGIDGVAGATGSDDTAATARDLGEVTGTGVVRLTGAIGDDPSLNPANPEPQFTPANQVDLYHFQISGPGQYAVLAEIFAGRIGSPLDPGVSLYSYNTADNTFVFIAGNNNTLNPTEGTDGSVPLFTDSALSAGLTAGDYYLAVTGGASTPSPLEGQTPDGPGILDPNIPGSAQNGYSTGAYVLNLEVEPEPMPPLVIASSPAAGQVLDQPPAEISVQFSEPINLQQLAFQAFEASDQAILPQVFIEASDGTRYYPRFISYDRQSNTATFQMLDRLPNGSYALHLSGPGGLTDLGGNAIAGNDPSGDDVIPFAVAGPDYRISGNMTNGYTVAAQVGQGSTQDLGVLFPYELQAGLTIVRNAQPSMNSGAETTQDEYEIKLTQSQNYSFNLSGSGLPSGARVLLIDPSGNVIPLDASDDGLSYFGPLVAGTYTLAVAGWAASESPSVSYQMTIDLVGTQDNAPPLLDGPSPALQLHFDGMASPTGAFAPVAPGGGSGGFTSLSVASASSGDSTPVAPNGGGSGASSPATSAPAHSSIAIFAAADTPGLTGLSLGALGGVASEAGPIPDLAAGSSIDTVQIALSLPSTAVLGSLISLITLTQMTPIGHVGGEAEPADMGADATAEVAGDVLVANPSQSRPEPSQAQTVAIPTTPATPASSTTGENVEPAIEPHTVAAEITAAAMPLGVLPAPADDQTVRRELAAPVAILGAALTTFWVRRAVRELSYKRKTRQNPTGQGHAAITNFTLEPTTPNHSSPSQGGPRTHRIRRSASSLDGLRSIDVR